MRNYCPILVIYPIRIPKDIAPVVYCAAMTEGCEEYFEFLWDKCMKTNVAAEQVLILNSLGCINNTEYLEVKWRALHAAHSS